MIQLYCIALNGNDSLNLCITNKYYKIICVYIERTKHVINTLNSNATLYDLQREIERLTSLPIPQQNLTSGFPPKRIDTTGINSNDVLLNELGIRHGDTVEIRNVKDVTDSTVQKGNGSGLLNFNTTTTVPINTVNNNAAE